MARITVEDCLVKENNRFALVLLASERTKQLLSGAKSLTDSKGNKSVVTSLREIADGKVVLLSGEESKKIREEREQARLEKEAQKLASQSQNATSGAASAPQPFNVDDLFKSLPTSGSDDDEEDEEIADIDSSDDDNEESEKKEVDIED